MSTTSAPPPSTADSAIVYLPIEPAAIDACASVGYHAFARFSISVSQPPEFVSAAMYRDAILAELDRPNTFHLMAVQPDADSNADHYVEGTGQVLGSVIMDCSDEAAAIGPISVSSSTHGRGIGRQLMVLCLAEAARRHFSSVRLNNIVSNIAAFALYHSLGFRAREYTVAVKGHIKPQQYKQLCEEMAAEGVSVRPMARTDIAACNALHVATTSFSRLSGITLSFEGQLSQRQLNGDTKGSRKDEEGGDGYQQPDDCCLVAVDRDSRIIGYCDGYDVDSHLSANTQHKATTTTAQHSNAALHTALCCQCQADSLSRAVCCVPLHCYSLGSHESVIVYLYATLSQRLQQLDPPLAADIHIISQRHGGAARSLVECRLSCCASSVCDGAW